MEDDGVNLPSASDREIALALGTIIEHNAKGFCQIPHFSQLYLLGLERSFLDEVLVKSVLNCVSEIFIEINVNT